MPGFKINDKVYPVVTLNDFGLDELDELEDAGLPLSDLVPLAEKYEGADWSAVGLTRDGRRILRALIYVARRRLEPDITVAESTRFPLLSLEVVPLPGDPVPDPDKPAPGERRRPTSRRTQDSSAAGASAPLTAHERMTANPARARRSRSSTSGRASDAGSS